MRIGLCTSGGDCPGLNAAIRAVVKASITHGKTEIVGVLDSVNGFMHDKPQLKPLASNDVSGLLDRGGTILGTSNKGSPFTDDEEGQKAKESLLKGWKMAGLDGLILIGGDGSQRIARKLFEWGVPIVGIPKTIDNDFEPSAISIGFMTAVDVVTDALSRLQSTAESHRRIAVVEVMGRQAGFIALYAAVAGGAHIALIPEIPYDLQSVSKKILERKKRGREHALVVVAEGAYEKGGSPHFRSSATGTMHLGGIADQVARRLHEMTGIDARVTVLGHVQRGGTPSVADRIFASMAGVSAFELAVKKQYGRVVCLRNGKMDNIKFEDIRSSGTTDVPLDGAIVRSAEAMGICLGR